MVTTWQLAANSNDMPLNIILNIFNFPFLEIFKILLEYSEAPIQWTLKVTKSYRSSVADCAVPGA